MREREGSEREGEGEGREGERGEGVCAVSRQDIL